VDHERGGVQQSVLAAIDNLALVVDQDQIGRLHQGKSLAEGVDPEVIRLDGIAESDVS